MSSKCCECSLAAVQQCIRMSEPLLCCLCWPIKSALPASSSVILMRHPDCSSTRKEREDATKTKRQTKLQQESSALDVCASVTGHSVCIMEVCVEQTDISQVLRNCPLVSSQRILVYLLNSVHTQWSHMHYIMALFTSWGSGDKAGVLIQDTQLIFCATPKYRGAWLSKSFVTKHRLGLLTQHCEGHGTNVLLSFCGSVFMCLSPSVFLCHMSPQHKLCKTRSSLQINSAQAQALSGPGCCSTTRIHWTQTRKWHSYINPSSV